MRVNINNIGDDWMGGPEEGKGAVEHRLHIFKSCPMAESTLSKVKFRWGGFSNKGEGG